MSQEEHSKHYQDGLDERRPSDKMITGGVWVGWLKGDWHMAKVNRGDGYLCPVCGATAQLSKWGRVYCPKQYDQKNPCSWAGYKVNNSSSPPAAAAPTTIAPLATPSQEQIKIFDSARDLIRSLAAAFLLMIARAGTGKTTCLVQCARIWMAQGLTCLFLCFAKRDKKALLKRIPEHGLAKVHTSNGAGLAILGNYLRGRNKGSFQFADEIAGEILRERLREDGEIVKGDDGKEKWEIEGTTYSAILSAANNLRVVKLYRCPEQPSDQDIVDVLDRFDVEFSPEEMPKISHYVKFLFRELSSLTILEDRGTDFTGQVFLPVYHNLKPRQTFSRVAIDETQDQNPYNREIAFLYLAPRGSMVAVGDENQAIYEWRGADSDGVEEIRSKMAARGKVDSLPLTICRRCCKVVVALAQTLVPDIQPLEAAPEGIRRDLATTDELFAELVEKKVGYVLSRTNAILVSLCLRLLAMGIPAVLARSNIISQLLTLIDNLSDRNHDLPVTEILERAKLWVEEQLAKASKKRNGESLARIVNDKYDCLAALASSDGIKTARDLKSKIISIFPKKDEEPDPSKYVVLSTVHGAKGNEAHTVYIVSPESNKGSVFDQVWSSPRDRDNTLYVAITRAEKEIVFVGPLPTFRRFSDMEQPAEAVAEVTPAKKTRKPRTKKTK